MLQNIQKSSMSESAHSSENKGRVLHVRTVA